MIFRRHLLALIFIVSVVSAQQSRKKTPEYGNVESITKEQLHTYLSFIASDELEGRDTPSKGLDIAAKFIATQLTRWNYTPAGDNGTFFQKIAIHKTRLIPGQTSIEFAGKKFSYGEDFIAQSIGGDVTAPLVYVKNGYIVKSKNINPYAGIDIKGRILVVLAGYPKGVSVADFGAKLGVDYDTPANYGKLNGAAGIVYIPSQKLLGQWEKDKNDAIVKGVLSVPALKTPDEKPAIPVATLSKNLVEMLFQGEPFRGQSMLERSYADSAEPFSFSNGKSLTLRVAVSVDTLSTQNIVAVREGSDPKAKNEYVAFGVHYDHVGIRSEPVNGDSIYNGADDDGSGTVGLLSMAEALAHGPKPKRSMLFVWHTGEEKGLWGSKYYVRYPTIPLENIVVQLNIDMIGRSKPDTGDASVDDDFTAADEIFSIGSMMMSTELGKLNEQVNASLFRLKLNYKFDDPEDPHKLFYRSDHYNYAKAGIPIVFYFDGLHADYHRVSDEVEKIDFEKLMKVTRTIYALGWKIANAPKRLVVDKEFPPERE